MAQFIKAVSTYLAHYVIITLTSPFVYKTIDHRPSIVIRSEGSAT